MKYGLGVQNIQLFANLKTLKAQYEINYLSKSTKNIYVLSSRIWEWEVKCNASQWFEPRNSNLFLSFTQTTFIHWNTYARSTQTKNIFGSFLRKLHKSPETFHKAFSFVFEKTINKAKSPISPFSTWGPICMHCLAKKKLNVFWRFRDLRLVWFHAFSIKFYCLFA